MQLNNLESAWRQMKLLNAMEPIASEEILAIIDSPQNESGSKLQRLVMNTIVLLVLTIICYGG